jgi:hypothetical protein
MNYSHHYSKLFLALISFILFPSLLALNPPEGAVGIRFKKTILKEKDLTYISTPSLVEEAYLRKKAQHYKFETEEDTLIMLKTSQKMVTIPPIFLINCL